MAHTCHAEGCATEVPPRLLMCEHHWRMVPEPLRRGVWVTYQPGQESGRVDVTDDYIIAARRAIYHVAVKEGRMTEQDAKNKIKQLQELFEEEE